MAILVDEPRWPSRNGVRFAHLVSDSSRAELDAFVARLDLQRPLRFHGDHYDIPAQLWDIVVDAGATPVTTRDIVSSLRAAGLRRVRVTATSAGSGRHRRRG
jgi:hypothetical protein